MTHECEQCGDDQLDNDLLHPNGYCETCHSNMSSYDKYVEVAQPVFPLRRAENNGQD
jgi:uncharacterized protein (DUF983 family)